MNDGLGDGFAECKETLRRLLLSVLSIVLGNVDFTFCRGSNDDGTETW